MIKRAAAIVVAFMMFTLGGLWGLSSHHHPTPALTAATIVIPQETFAQSLAAYKASHRNFGPVNTIRVVRGQSLTTIAKEVGLPWKSLYCYNKKIIGDNPSALKTGEILGLGSAHCKIPAPPKPVVIVSAPVNNTPNVVPPPVTNTPVAAGDYSCGALESLWVSAGGPAGVEVTAAAIAMAESGGNPNATEPNSGAAGLWQILGTVVPGNVYNPFVNAENAVKKYDDAGGFSPWVTYTTGAYSGLC